jgi:hypothetical protein
MTYTFVNIRSAATVRMLFTFVNIRSAPTVRMLFIVITVNECYTSSPVHARSHTVTVMVLLTVLWAMTVKHYYYWGKMQLVL